MMYFWVGYYYCFFPFASDEFFWIVVRRISTNYCFWIVWQWGKSYVLNCCLLGSVVLLLNAASITLSLACGLESSCKCILIK